MGKITIHSILMNASSRLPNGRERRLLDQVAELMDYRIPVRDEARDLGARVIEFDEDESTSEIGAVCPHCKREPVPVQCNPVQFGPIPVLQFTCSGCRKVLGFSIVPPLPANMRTSDRTESGLILAQ
jgi:hypothetical protein